MKYKVGNKVRIKSLDWYNKNKDENGNVHCGDKVFDNYMSVFCESVVTIGGVYPYNGYNIREDMHCRAWTDDMIEGLVNYADGQHDMNEWVLPKGFEFHDENGNVINATKIVLEKKKEYPKTYEECCLALEYIPHTDDIIGYKWDILQSLQKLLICRDAYWKIAGEEMRLGKPWDPTTEIVFCISRINNRIEHLYKSGKSDILEFPTPEMRDAFYENFKELIEQCKEFL